MIHYVSLEHLPDGFRIPESLRERFWYDEDKRVLAYDGAMYKSTFDRIRGISKDYDYLRAVEELFRLAVPEDGHSQHHSHLVAAATGAVLAVAILAAGVFFWEHMRGGQPLPHAPTTMTHHLAGN